MSFVLNYQSLNKANNFFYFYLIKSGTFPNFDMMSSNPAVSFMLNRFVVLIKELYFAKATIHSLKTPHFSLSKTTYLRLIIQIILPSMRKFLMKVFFMLI